MADKIGTVNHNWTLIGILSVILIGEAVGTGLIPVSQGHLIGYLGVKSSLVWTGLLLYFLNYLAIDFFQCFKGYVVLKLALWYRAIRTDYVINNLDTEHTNIPQRIQEDIKISYFARITVWAEYAVSGVILVQLFLLNLTQPVLLIFAIAYALFSVFIAYQFNPRLTRAEIDSQQAEASYRTSLSDRITNLSLLPLANLASLGAARIKTEYLLFTKLQLCLVVVLPYVVLIPKLLSGSIDLGTLVKHQSTFALIVMNAAVLIQFYSTLIQGRASDYRVKEITK